MIILGSTRISSRPTPFQSRFERDWCTVLGWVSQPINSADADGPSLSPTRGFLARPSHARHSYSYAAGHLRPRRARPDERVREVRTSSIRIRRGRDPTIVPTCSSVQNDRQHSFFPFPSQPYFLSKKAPASGGCPLHLRPSRACNTRPGTLFLYHLCTVNCRAEARNQCRQYVRCGGSLRRGQSVLCRARVISLRASAIRHRRLSVGGEEGGCPLLAMGLDSSSPFRGYVSTMI